jgi:type II secretory pathway pseudopilin PulG
MGFNMDNWTGWATALLGFLLSVVGFNMRADKKRQEEHAKECNKRDADFAQRLARVESTLVTDKHVREILKEYLDPIIKMQVDINEIKVQLARIPKRKDDEV